MSIWKFDSHFSKIFNSVICSKGNLKNIPNLKLFWLSSGKWNCSAAFYSEVKSKAIKKILKIFHRKSRKIIVELHCCPCCNVRMTSRKWFEWYNCTILARQDIASLSYTISLFQNVIKLKSIVSFFCRFSFLTLHATMNKKEQLAITSFWSETKAKIPKFHNWRFSEKNFSYEKLKKF